MKYVLGMLFLCFSFNVNANEFPQLIMKKEFELEKVQRFQPSTFVVNKNADIYDERNGNVVQKWSKERLFTSYIQTEKWMKITGYFKDKVWIKSPQSLWVKRSDIMKK